MSGCATDLARERFLLGELPAGADLAHIAACAACQARLATMRADGEAYLASPEAGALARLLDDAPARTRRSRPRTWLAAGALGLAAAGLLLWPHAAADRTPGRAADRAADREAEVAAVEHAWVQAYLDQDAAALDAILAPDYTFTDGAGGVTTKPDDLRDARAHRVHFDAWDSTDVRIRVWGDTAVVTGHSLMRGTVAGRPFSNHIAFTDTLTRIAGRWRAVSAHVSKAR